MGKIDDLQKMLLKCLENNGNDVVFINRQIYSISSLLKYSTDELIELLCVKPGMKLYKYCPYNKYAIENIDSGCVYLNDPVEFDDVFDSSSDTDEYNFINYRLQFYLKTLKIEYDVKASNKELEMLLFIKLGAIAGTYDMFLDYINKSEIDELNSLRLGIIYQNAMQSSFDKSKSISAALKEEFKDFCNNASKYRISCFTTNPVNLKMWSLYADYCKGICIEYTVSDNLDKLVYSVLYSHVRGDYNYCMIHNDMKSDDEFIGVLINSVLRKDVSWIEQDEYRFVSAKNEYKDNYAKFYPITAIYMGNRISAVDCNHIKNTCKKMNIDCYYMQRSINSFELAPLKINLD